MYIQLRMRCILIILVIATVGSRVSSQCPDTTHMPQFYEVEPLWWERLTDPTAYPDSLCAGLYDLAPNGIFVFDENQIFVRVNNLGGIETPYGITLSKIDLNEQGIVASHTVNQRTESSYKIFNSFAYHNDQLVLVGNANPYPDSLPGYRGSWDAKPIKRLIDLPDMQSFTDVVPPTNDNNIFPFATYQDSPQYLNLRGNPVAVSYYAWDNLVLHATAALDENMEVLSRDTVYYTSDNPPDDPDNYLLGRLVNNDTYVAWTIDNDRADIYTTAQAAVHISHLTPNGTLDIDTSIDITNMVFPENPFARPAITVGHNKDHSVISRSYIDQEDNFSTKRWLIWINHDGDLLYNTQDLNVEGHRYRFSSFIHADNDAAYILGSDSTLGLDGFDVIKVVPNGDPSIVGHLTTSEESPYRFITFLDAKLVDNQVLTVARVRSLDNEDDQLFTSLLFSFNAADLGIETSTVSVETLSSKESESLIIYPNPASRGDVTIEVEDANQVQVYSTVGTMIRKVPCSSGAFTLDVRDLSSGMYIISSVNTVTGTATHGRLIVQH